MTEYEMSPRTFMGTLTCSLDEHIQLDAAARTRLHKHGVDFDGLPSAEKFGERCVELGAHITLWIKRVRAYGAKFRYLMIAEPHNSEEMGQRPHVHMLIHEQSEGSFYTGPLGWVRGKNGQWHEAIPDDAPCRVTWPLGFTRFERVSDARSARYICKYVSKTAMLRIRASQSYGDPPPFYAPKVHSEEIISHVSEYGPLQAAAAGPLTNGAAYQAMEWTDG